MRYRRNRTFSILGLIASAVFIAAGLFVIIPQYGSIGILWTFLAAFVTVANGLIAFAKRDASGKSGRTRNGNGGDEVHGWDAGYGREGNSGHSGDPVAFRRKAVYFRPSKTEVEEMLTANGAGRKDRDPEERLMELYRLYNRRLISEKDYRERRAKILKDVQDPEGTKNPEEAKNT
jgi:hypothetical protein